MNEKDVILAWNKIGPAARAAADWWGEQVQQKPTFDNEYNDDGNMLARIMATINANIDDDISSKKLDLFKLILANLIQTQLNTNTSITIGTDYNPCETLSAAIEKSKINAKIPRKTLMRIDAEKVSVWTEKHREHKTTFPIDTSKPR